MASMPAYRPGLVGAEKRAEAGELLLVVAGLVRCGGHLLADLLGVLLQIGRGTVPVGALVPVGDLHRLRLGDRPGAGREAYSVYRSRRSETRVLAVGVPVVGPVGVDGQGVPGFGRRALPFGLLLSFELVIRARPQGGVHLVPGRRIASMVRPRAAESCR
ncbi:hypothetical protein NLX86_27805 [Streptomyces sp. A3M-1-3]|uniref:hypothetical protein n=1 Tax=Streptomyces sp. A3M-1-3 TaxID=2962044 RepID=UPI0020B861FE|nr:hypothetical protein [Streptomyces sp. A3M-1-3]MCP3821760.1 hypothetical protein [Streptomyces sp. A3M-1-3]